jgi:two-component sensor histidine kinase
MNVILQGDGRPYGVLEVDSQSKGEFTEHDLAFLQGAANMLGMAIERQRFERDLAAAVEHQEVLLQEGNHRVTNSLQLVSSMLSLQAATAKPAMRAQLQDAIARISAIARAHQRLYLTRQIQSLDLGQYLIDVCHDLDKTTAHCDIVIDAADGVQVATDRAIPITLLVMELITNAAKHAFEKGKSFSVWVSLATNDNDEIIIKVRDEGRGLPEGFDFKTSKGLGMQIVVAFLRQLQARFRIERRNPGTEFVLEIPLAARDA